MITRYPENCREEIAPQSGSVLGLRLTLELGLGDNFPRGQFS